MPASLSADGMDRVPDTSRTTNAAGTRAWTGALAAGGILAALFWLERRYPLRHAGPEPDRNRVARNLMVAAITAVVISRCEQPLVKPVAERVENQRIGLLLRLGLRPLPEKLLGIVLLDYTLYWWHVLLHRVPWLWRAHMVHHTDLTLDTTTALRFHWLEFLASVPWRLAQVAILGIRPSVLALWQRLTFIEVLFHHSNVRLPMRVEKPLSRLVVTPRLHGIHHSANPDERHSNFSSGLAVWDSVHRTRKTGVPQARITIGLSAYRSAQDLRLPDLIALPFRRQRME